MYKLAVFDMDGTILDTLQDLANGVNYVMRKHGFPEQSLDQVRIHLGRGMKFLIDNSVPEGTPESVKDQCLTEFKPYYGDHCRENTAVYAGIPALLDRLRSAGVLVAVVSNKADYAVQILIDEYFGRSAFDLAVGEKADVRRKPAPDAIDACRAALGSATGISPAGAAGSESAAPAAAVNTAAPIERTDTVYIGDSEVDLETAQNACTDFIGVSYGFRGRAFLEARGASVIADTADEIGDLILGR